MIWGVNLPVPRIVRKLRGRAFYDFDLGMHRKESRHNIFSTVSNIPSNISIRECPELSLWLWGFETGLAEATDAL